MKKVYEDRGNMIRFHLVLLLKGHHSVNADTAAFAGICYTCTSRQKKTLSVVGVMSFSMITRSLPDRDSIYDC